MIGCFFGGWVASPWSKSAVFGVPKGWLLQGFCWFIFVSAQFAVLGMIADSEYVDSMENNRTSMLYANSSRPRIVRLDPLQHDQLLLLPNPRLLEVDGVFLEKYVTP